MYGKLSPILREHELLLCPTLALPSVFAWHQCNDQTFSIDGKPCNALINWSMTYPFNLLSRCPAATVPSGFASSGVPTGLQIVGRTYEDASVLHAALSYEAAKPRIDTHPPI